MTEIQSNARVLVVEDEAIVCADIQDRLRSHGYDVVGSADNGPEAIEMTATLKPDLVLMDIMLKGSMLGTEAASHIGSHLHVPVIYLTANSNNEVFRTARDTRPSGFILKPFDENALTAAIEIALHKHHWEREREDLISQLQTALAQVKTLAGMLPICANCKKIRDEHGHWNQLEEYIVQHSDASFTHGICPTCKVDFLASIGLEDTAPSGEDKETG